MDKNEKNECYKYSRIAKVHGGRKIRNSEFNQKKSESDELWKTPEAGADCWSDGADRLVNSHDKVAWAI